MRRRNFTLVAVLGLLLVRGAFPALAHPTATESEVPSGSTSTMTFRLEHGCDGSPTVSVSILIPDGVASIEVEAKNSWEGTFDGTSVHWTGGPAAANQPHDFAISALITAPAGEALYFPILQECVEGVLRWFAIPGEGQTVEDLEFPAAVFEVVEGVEPPEEATITSAVAETTTTVAQTAPTAPPETTTTSIAATPTGSTLATTAPEDTDDGAPIGVIALLVAGIAVVIGLGAYALRRNS